MLRSIPTDSTASPCRIPLRTECDRLRCTTQLVRETRVVFANHRNHRSEGLDELVGDVEGSEGLGRLAHARLTRERRDSPLRFACVDGLARLSRSPRMSQPPRPWRARASWRTILRRAAPTSQARLRHESTAFREHSWREARCRRSREAAKRRWREAPSRTLSLRREARFWCWFSRQDENHTHSDSDDSATASGK